MKKIILIKISLILISTKIFGQTIPQNLIVETGKIEGSAYRIVIPENWNNNLILMAHGYFMEKIENYDKEIRSPFYLKLLDEGFALGESGYQKTGWAVEEAFQDIENLRIHFNKKHPKPDSLYLIGLSMGGLITLGLIEMNPSIYNGALLLAPVVCSANFFHNYLLDRLLVFEYFYPGNDIINDTFFIDPSIPLTDAESFTKVLSTNSDHANLISEKFNIKSKFLPLILYAYYDAYKDLYLRGGGVPIDNINKYYLGFKNDIEINKNIRRIRGNNKAIEYNNKYYTPTGKISVPIISLTHTSDPLVPCECNNYFRLKVMATGTEEFYKQYYIEGNGHLDFDESEWLMAFNILRNWCSKGKKPDDEIFLHFD